MKFSALSLDSQLAILSQLPSRTLLSAVPLVCARWNQLQSHVCRQRRAVKLIICPNPQQLAAPRHFDLFPAPLDTTYAIALPATFPSVTHLVIYHRNLSFETFEEKKYLLQSWAPNLVSLDFASGDVDVSNEAALTHQLSPALSVFFDRLLALLNQMPRLKRLCITTFGFLETKVDLSDILSRLVDIELNFFLTERLVLQLLQHCSSNLQRLSISKMWHFRDFLPLLTSPFMCSKLERLVITNFDVTQLAITFDHCSRLRALKLLMIREDNYAEHMHLLTKLPELTELTLSVSMQQLPVNGQNFPLDPDTALVPLPVLPSIRHLAISACFLNVPFHEYFIQAIQLDHVFPQLQKIWFEWHNKVPCPQCDTNSPAPYSCIDALLRPVARLETLQVATVRINRNDFDWLPRLRSQ